MNDLFTAKQLKTLKQYNKIRPWLLINEGAIRSGKSVLDLDIFLTSLNRHRNEHKAAMITAKTMGSLDRNVLADLYNRYGFRARLDRFGSFPLLGNTIHCFGTNTVEAYEGISGFTAFEWLGNEITYQDPIAVKESFGRCSDPDAHIIWDGNCDAPNHNIKVNYIDKADNKRIMSVHWDIEDNTFLTPEYIENLKKTTPSGVWYDRKIKGLWTTAEGMIYSDWNQNKMIIDKPLNPIKRYIAGVDFGFEHLGVMVVFGIDDENNVYLIKEIASAHRNMDWWEQQKRILEDTVHYGRMPFYCDTARPEYILQLGGFDARKEVIEGIEYISGLMKQGKFYILKNKCPEFEREIYLYAWDSKAAKEQPIKRNDDVMDAVRYALYTDYIEGIEPSSGTGAISIQEDPFYD